MRFEKIEYNFNIFKPHDYKIIYYMLYALLYIWRVTRREFNQFSPTHLLRNIVTYSLHNT